MSARSKQFEAIDNFRLEVEGHTYTLRRPTPAEAIGLADSTGLDLVHRFVVGWDHTELSLGFPGGTDRPEPFDADLWVAYVDRHPVLWKPLAESILDAYAVRRTALEDAAKN